MFILFCFLIVISGCNTWKSRNIQDYSYLYDNKTNSIHPEYKLYHTGPDSSFLYFRIDTDNLLYSRTDRNSDFKGRIKIHY
ncbi:MAG: hypothetical protein ABEH43_02390, partial [Flavobacteriales bacterium]